MRVDRNFGGFEDGRQFDLRLRNALNLSVANDLSARLWSADFYRSELDKKDLAKRTELAVGNLELHLQLVPFTSREEKKIREIARQNNVKEESVDDLVARRLWDEPCMRFEFIIIDLGKIENVPPEKVNKMLEAVKQTRERMGLVNRDTVYVQRPPLPHASQLILDSLGAIHLVPPLISLRDQVDFDTALGAITCPEKKRQEAGMIIGKIEYIKREYFGDKC